MDSEVQIVILAGGLGKRLNSRTNGKPKPMAKLVNFSLIEHQIRYCASLGFSSFAILASYKSKILEEHVRNIELSGITIELLKEDVASGTAGALLRFAPQLHETIIVLYGDTYITVDLRDVLRSYRNDLSTENFIGSVIVHPNSHPHDSDLVVVDSQNWIQQIIPYPRQNDQLSRNLVNAALYVLNARILSELTLEHLEQDKTDIAKDLFPYLIQNNYKLKAIHNCWFIKDCGTPNRLDSVSEILKHPRSNLNSQQPKGVVFVDRDGCINEESGYISQPDQLRLIPGAADGIQVLNKANIPVICVTNQAVIARGEATHEDMHLIHSKIDKELGEIGAFLDKIIYCPHHPDIGYDGEVKDLKIKCDCRKPGVGMALEASKNFKIDFSKSWMVGDTTTDLRFANNLGMTSILLRTGYAGSDHRENIVPDFIFDDLMQASDFIVFDYQRIRKFFTKHINILVDKKIIFIGGKSRAGKSTVAKVIQKMLTGLGDDVLIIPTDSWLIDVKKRNDQMRLEEKYDLQSLNKFSQKLQNGSRPIYASVDHRICYDDAPVLQPTTIFKNTKIILEGCATSLIDPDIINQGIFIWIDIDEDVRKLRFYKKYMQKGLGEQKISEIYKDRVRHEDEFLDKYSKLADIFWRVQ